MKKTIFLIILASCAIVSCSKKEIAESPVVVKGTQIITATVNAETKLAYSEVTTAEKGMVSVWEAGDKFSAIQINADDTTTVEFSLVAGEGTASGTFVATTSGVVDDTKWVAVLGSNAVSQGSGKELHCSYMNQDGTLAGLSKYNYVVAEGTGLKPNFNFNEGEKLSYILRVKLPEGIKCIEYTPCAWNKISAANGREIIYLNESDGAKSNDYGPSKTSTITLKNASAAGDVVYISIPCLDYSRTYMSYNNNKQNMNLRMGVVLTIMNDVSDQATKSNGYVFENNITGKPGKIQTIDMSELKLVNRPTPSECIKLATDTVVLSKPHASALWQAGKLETYWAPYNIGATKASESGKYIAFGEAYDNGEYTYVKYTLRHKTDGTTNRDDIITNLYNKLVDNGDNKTFYSVTSSRYDAARVIWGSAWRMPHCVEIQLLLNSKKAAEKLDGVDCIKFTHGSSNIYFPAAGAKKDNATIDADYAVIWTADMVQRSASNPGWNAAYALYVKKDLSSAGCDRYGRYDGLNVRPVLVKSSIK